MIRNKRRSREILPMFDAILVMKRDTLQEIVPLGKGYTMLMFLKMMNQTTKGSDGKDDLVEEYVLISTLTSTA